MVGYNSCLGNSPIIPLASVVGARMVKRSTKSSDREVSGGDRKEIYTVKSHPVHE